MVGQRKRWSGHNDEALMAKTVYCNKNIPVEDLGKHCQCFTFTDGFRTSAALMALGLTQIN